MVLPRTGDTLRPLRLRGSARRHGGIHREAPARPLGRRLSRDGARRRTRWSESPRAGATSGRDYDRDLDDDPRGVAPRRCARLLAPIAATPTGQRPLDRARSDPLAGGRHPPSTTGRARASIHRARRSGRSGRRACRATIHREMPGGGFRARPCAAAARRRAGGPAGRVHDRRGRATTSSSTAITCCRGASASEVQDAAIAQPRALVRDGAVDRRGLGRPPAAELATRARAGTLPGSCCPTSSRTSTPTRPGRRILVGLPDRHLLTAGSLRPDDDDFAALFADFVVEQSGGADEPIDRRVFELVDGRLVEFAGV